MTRLFEKIFKKNQSQTGNAPEEINGEGEQSLQTNQDQNEEVDQIHTEPNRKFSWDFGCSQSVGQVRETNEDSCLAFSGIIPIDGELVTIGLFIVADGMGGHQSGEIASNLAVRVFGSQIIQQIIQPSLDIENPFTEFNLTEILSESIQAANISIASKAPGSGTTLTAALIAAGQLFIAHVGDSRAYAISSDGNATPLTRDHSLVQRMIELGQLSVDEASNHPQRNVLYKALGQGDPLSPEILQFKLPQNGSILLCSDGLWGVISQDDMIKIILEHQAPGEACQKLVEAANLAGGPDNISALLIRFT